MVKQFLAVDLGAESGRAMLGRLRGGMLDVSEVHRFQNQPHRVDGSLRWNAMQLWSDVRRALDASSAQPLDSVGVDTWGVDYALLDQEGQLIEDPYHYRDSRTAGAMEQLFARVGRERIYATTGIQCLPINTIYQLHAACRATPEIIARARTLLTMPDLFNYWLTGRRGFATKTRKESHSCFVISCLRGPFNSSATNRVLERAPQQRDRDRRIGRQILR